MRHGSRRTAAWVGVLLASATALTACGPGDSTVEPGGRNGSNGSLRLVVSSTEEIPFIEGAFALARVRASDGSETTRAFAPFAAGDIEVLRQEVSPGTYAVSAWLWPCSGACGDSPSPEAWEAYAASTELSCEAAVTMGEDESDRTVTFRFSPAHDRESCAGP